MEFFEKIRVPLSGPGGGMEFLDLFEPLGEDGEQFRPYPAISWSAEL